ncbi:hypothetical protein GOV14_00435 [Candidatus Pacearchaeota archaeon]|nr:hypothetical protein [Candidatus Pacearchaeota archaeon]
MLKEIPDNVLKKIDGYARAYNVVVDTTQISERLRGKGLEGGTDSEMSVLDDLNDNDNDKIHQIWYVDYFNDESGVDLRNSVLVLTGSKYCGKLDDFVTELDLDIAQNDHFDLHFHTWPFNALSGLKRKDAKMLFDYVGK